MPRALVPSGSVSSGSAPAASSTSSAARLPSRAANSSGVKPPADLAWTPAPAAINASAAPGLSCDAVHISAALAPPALDRVDLGAVLQQDRDRGYGAGPGGRHQRGLALARRPVGVRARVEQHRQHRGAAVGGGEGERRHTVAGGGVRGGVGLQELRGQAQVVVVRGPVQRGGPVRFARVDGGTGVEKRANHHRVAGLDRLDQGDAGGLRGVRRGGHGHEPRGQPARRPVCQCDAHVVSHVRSWVAVNSSVADVVLHPVGAVSAQDVSCSGRNRRNLTDPVDPERFPRHRRPVLARRGVCYGLSSSTRRPCGQCQPARSGSTPRKVPLDEFPGRQTGMAAPSSAPSGL